MVKPGAIAADVGVGMAAGLVGTVAITASTMLEAKLRNRPDSDAPAQAAQKVLGVETHTDADKARLSNMVHWAYGTGWGAVRGLLGAAGLSPVTATLVHAGLVWGAEQAMLPALELAPPATEQDATSLAVDGAHHLLYAVATGAAYSALSRQR